MKKGDIYRNDYWAIFEITEVTDQLVFVRIKYNSSIFKETSWPINQKFEMGLVKLSSLEIQLL